MADVNIGTGPNSGDGDPLRQAFIKLNQNDQSHEQRIDGLAGSTLITLGNIGGNGDIITAELDASAVAAGITTIPVGGEFRFRAEAVNTAVNPTITVGGVTLSIRSADGSALPAGGLQLGKWYKIVRYTPTLARMITAEVDRAALAEKAGIADLRAETAQAPALLPHDDGRTGADISSYEDIQGNPLQRMDAAGFLHLPNLSRPVQDYMSDQALGDLWAICDEQDVPVIAQRADGRLAVLGLDLPVQDGIRAASRQTAAYGRTVKDRFTQTDLLFLDMARAGAGVPPPLDCYPTNWSPGASWINNLSVPTPGFTDIDTPYGMNHGVVHPSLVEFYAGFRGYRYLLGITGYGRAQEEFENPFILGSNDLQNWTLLDGFEQPLAQRPDVESGHLSDIHLTHDPRSGQLVCIWRQSVRLDGPGSASDRIQEQMFYKATADGYRWTETKTILQGMRDVDIMLSPSALYDPQAGVWHLYTSTGRHVWHRTAPELTGPWSEPDVITMPSGFRAWHPEVRWCGDKLVMLIHDRDADNLFFGVSDDWQTWTFGVHFLTGVNAGTYKATFIPEISGNDWRPVVVWTSDASAANRAEWWNLYVSHPSSFLPME